VKRYMLFFINVLVILMLTACSVGGGAVTTSASTGQTSPTTASAGAANTTAVQAIIPETTASAVLAHTGDTHEDTGDNDVDLAYATSITFNGSSSSASGAGISVNGATVTITEPGDYRLSGSLNDGQVIVNASADGAVRLILDGVSLNSSTSAPLYIMDADKVVVILADHTQTAITDATSYVYPSADVAEPNAAIFSNADLSIAGTGQCF